MFAKKKKEKTMNVDDLPTFLTFVVGGILVVALLVVAVHFATKPSRAQDE